MSVAITKENFFWHKLHSLTGIVPIGFYLVQHLLLNSFSLAGPDKYNGVSGFFYSMPDYILYGIEILLVWLPLVFHSVYGLFITSRGQVNYFSTKYKFNENLMYTLQRYSGVYLFFFLCLHIATTTIQAKIAHSTSVVDFDHMHAWMTNYWYLGLVIYVLGVLTASYHFSYGIWNFCIRWGISVSQHSQHAVKKFSTVLFVVVTLIGWGALAGFFMHG